MPDAGSRATPAITTLTKGFLRSNRIANIEHYVPRLRRQQSGTRWCQADKEWLVNGEMAELRCALQCRNRFEVEEPSGARCGSTKPHALQCNSNPSLEGKYDESHAKASSGMWRNWQTRWT